MMIRAFVIAWMAYFVLIAVSPLTPIYGEWQSALLLQFAFVALVILGDRLIRSLWGASEPDVREAVIDSARTMARVALCLSVIGVLAFAFDKVFVQGIDYSQGIGSAREQWRVIGLNRAGPSSVFSAAGYLLGSAYFVTVFLVFSQYRAFPPRERILLLAASVALALAVSYLTGGRSSLLLLCAFAAVAPFVRSNGRLGDVFPRRWQRVAIACGALVLAAYVVFVTGERAAISGVPTALYVQRGVLSLGFELSDWYVYASNGSSAAALLAGVLFAGSYLTHSFSTVSAMMSVPSDGQVVLFSYGLRLLARAGLIAPPGDDWFLAGRFPSLPGGLWYQFGLVAFAVASLVAGAMNAIAALWSSRHPGALFPAAFHASIGVILVLSPLLFAGDLLAFPFAMFAFVVVAGLQLLLRLPVFAARTDRRTLLDTSGRNDDIRGSQGGGA